MMGSAPSGCPIRGNFNFNYETAASTSTTRPSRRLNHATTAPLKRRNHHAPPSAQPQRARGISPWDPNPLNYGFASILTQLIGRGPKRRFREQKEVVFSPNPAPGTRPTTTPRAPTAPTHPKPTRTHHICRNARKGQYPATPGLEL